MEVGFGERVSDQGIRDMLAIAYSLKREADCWYGVMFSMYGI